MTHTIRRAEPADLHDLISLGRRTFVETYRGMGTGRPAGLEETYGRQTFNEDRLRPQIRSDSVTYLLAFSDAVAVGFAKIERGEVPACVPEDASVQLAQLYVLKDFQGRGLGKALLEAAVQTCTDYRGLWLGVWDMNAPAIRFYERAGFRKVGTAKWRFGTYEDTDLIYFRQLR